MKIEKLEIKNFRGIHDLTIHFDELTLLIGENNAGKSSVLDALQICLTKVGQKKNVFAEYDYLLESSASDPTTADPILLKLYISEMRPGEWPDEIHQLLDPAIQIDANGVAKITVQIESSFNATLGDFDTKSHFLDLAGGLLVKASTVPYFIKLQQIVPIFYLSAVRDAVQEFRPKSQFWGPFVKSFQLDPPTKQKLEKSLDQINKKVLGAHGAFKVLKKHLSEARHIIPLEGKNPVDIEAFPSRIFDLLARAQVTLTSKTGAKLPLQRHGEGTKSLSVILLFDAFLKSKMLAGYSNLAMPVLALEEPEAHLHPSAIHSVASMLRDLRGQKIIATHSGDLLAAFPPTSIRRLRRIAGKVQLFSIPENLFTPSETQTLDHHVRLNRGNIYFSKLWIFVEGETECFLFSECARILGTELHAAGICCVEHSKIGLEKLIKLADGLGIDWICVSDNDPKGMEYSGVANRYLNGKSALVHNHVLSHGDIEVYLCSCGFDKIYFANMSPMKSASVVATKGTVEYWKQVTDALPRHSKIKTAIEVRDKIAELGKGKVPKEFKKIINDAIALARNAT